MDVGDTVEVHGQGVGSISRVPQYLPLYTVSVRSYTAMTQYQKFKTNIPREGIAWPQSQFAHSCVCERFTYSHDRSAFPVGKYVDRSWEYINRSQTHECGNWDWGRAIPFLGIHTWDFVAVCKHRLTHVLYRQYTPTLAGKVSVIYILRGKEKVNPAHRQIGESYSQTMPL